MLKLCDVRFVYPDKTTAIDSVSFTAKDGESIALIGGNGAGKTSLLLTIVGILEPSGGTVELDGIRLNKSNLNEIRKRIGVVFQNPDDQLFMPLIYDDVAFGCRSYGLSEAETALRVEKTLERLNISHLRERSSLKLSGGEKRLAAIATVLVMEPDVIMLDEPTAFLDPKARRGLIETLKQPRQTKIIATHDLAFAAEVCERVILLKDGRVAAEGTTDILKDRQIMRACGLAE